MFMHAELIRGDENLCKKRRKILYYCTLNMILQGMYMRILLVIFCLECESVFFLSQISFSIFFIHKKAVFLAPRSNVRTLSIFFMRYTGIKL